MKKFKEYMTEDHGARFDPGAGLSSTPKPYDLGSAEVVAKINAILGHTAVSEYMNPKAALKQIEAKLALLGLATSETGHIDNGDFNESGEHVIEFKLFGDQFGKSVDTPHDEFDKKTETVNLNVRLEKLDTGSFKVYGSI